MDDFSIQSKLDTPKLETPQLEGADGRAGEPDSRFGELISRAIRDLNQNVQQAESKAQDFANGKAGEVETVLALNRADIELKFAVELRNRALEAYNQIIRLSV